jgi:hypothetical protein
MGRRGRHAAYDSIGETKDGSVPAIVFDNSSDNENPVSLDSWRITFAKQIVWSEIATELRG